MTTVTKLMYMTLMTNKIGTTEVDDDAFKIRTKRNEGGNRTINDENKIQQNEQG